jgi:hypothetical protein
LAGFWELPEPIQLPAAQVGASLREFRHTIVNTIFKCQVHQASLIIVPKGFSWLPKNNLHAFPLSTTARKALKYRME